METIEVSVDGQILTGMILIRTPANLEVKLIHPFKGNILAGSSIPSFARRVKTFTGEYGTYEAKQLIGRLYSYYKAIYANKKTTERAWHSYSALANPLKAEIQALEYEQKLLRAAFRRGSLSQTAYQAALKSCRETIFQKSQALEEVFDRFLQPLFPNPIPYGIRTGLLKHLQAWLEP